MEYFKHDINASEDDKICDLLATHGYEMLGYYWRFVEYLYSRGGKVASSKVTSVAWSLHMEVEKLKLLISDFNLFVDDGENVYSRRVLSEVEEFEANGQRLSEAGRKGGRASAIARAKARLEATVEAPLDDGLTDGEAQAQQNKKNKKKKEKKQIDDLDSFFDSLWAEYPKKKGKSAVTKKAKEELLEAGEDAVLLAIKNYRREIQEKGTDEQFILYGSTFFNGRWRDYVSDVPEPTQKQKNEVKLNEAGFPDIDFGLSKSGFDF